MATAVAVPTRYLGKPCAIAQSHATPIRQHLLGKEADCLKLRKATAQPWQTDTARAMPGSTGYEFA